MNNSYRDRLLKLGDCLKIEVNSLFIKDVLMKIISLKIMVFIFCISLSSAAYAIKPANPNANSDVKLILNYFSSLKSRTDHRLVSGQFIGYSNGANNSGMLPIIYNKTGKWMGIVGSDYGQWYPYHHITYNYTNPELIKAWKAGSLVTIQVMLTNPANPNGAGIFDQGVDLNDLLIPGTDTYSRWISEMDTIAAGLSQLKDSGVVVMFRPFHEMNGSWFWWGGKPTTLFVKVWKQMFDYYTNTKKLNNLIWVFSTYIGNNATSFYPGDAYVDITGFDAYTSNVTADEIAGYSSMVALSKPFAFTEFGPENASNPSGTFDYRIFINGVKTYFPDACYFMSWDDNWSMATNTYVKEALSNNYVANRDNLNWTPPTGLTKIGSDAIFKDIKVFPNPLLIGNSLHIKLKELISGEEIKINIFDISGKLISQQTLYSSNDGNYEIKNVRSLLRGIYLLKMESNKKSAKIRLEII